MIPMLKEVLASPHQPRFTRTEGARGILFRRFWAIKHTQERLADRGGGTWSFTQGDQKLPAKEAMLHKKEWINGKMQDM